MIVVEYMENGSLDSFLRVSADFRLKRCCVIDELDRSTFL